MTDLKQFDEYKLKNIIIVEEIGTRQIKFYSTVTRTWSKWLDGHSAAGNIHDWMRGHGCSLSDLYVAISDPDITLMRVDKDGNPTARRYEVNSHLAHLADIANGFIVTSYRYGLPDEIKKMLPETDKFTGRDRINLVMGVE